MTATIKIERLRIHARHGVIPQERIVGAWFYVSMEAEFNCAPEAYLDDQLSGTINYADIVSCIAQQLDTPSQLLEHLVYRSGQSLMDTFPQINHLTFSIFKENPPMKAQCDEIGIKMDFARQ